MTLPQTIRDDQGWCGTRFVLFWGEITARCELYSEQRKKSGIGITRFHTLCLAMAGHIETLRDIGVSGHLRKALGFPAKILEIAWGKLNLGKRRKQGVGIPDLHQ